MNLPVKKMPIISIGCDPEIFVKDLKSKSFISGHTMTKGTKENPEKWKEGALQADGVALEFNITPAKNAETFTNRVLDNLHYIRGLVQGYNEKYALAITPTAIFSENYFKTLPEDVRKLGCQPDFNAYTGEVNSKPETKKPFRTGAGHVHVGWYSDKNLIDDVFEPQHFITCTEMVKQLDVSLFLPSLLFDNDTQRRKLYGSPGSFRPKAYGFEYRPLSNKWLRNATLITWVFNTTLRSVRDSFNGIDYTEFITTDEIEEALKYVGTKKISGFIKSLQNKHPDIIKIPKGFN